MITIKLIDFRRNCPEGRRFLPSLSYTRFHFTTILPILSLRASGAIYLESIR